MPQDKKKHSIENFCLFGLNLVNIPRFKVKMRILSDHESRRQERWFLAFSFHWYELLFCKIKRERFFNVFCIYIKHSQEKINTIFQTKPKSIPFGDVFSNFSLQLISCSTAMLLLMVKRGKQKNLLLTRQLL